MVVDLIAVCDTEKDAVEGSDELPCHHVYRAVTKKACDIVDYGQTLKDLLNKFGMYVGAVLILLGGLFLFYGIAMLKGLKVVLAGSFVWAALFGLAYNLFPQ
jgi:hypothetical protein